MKSWDIVTQKHFYRRGKELWTPKEQEGKGPFKAVPEWNWTWKQVEELCERVDCKVQ